MKKLLLSLLLSCLVTCTLVSSVSAQPLPYFTIKFDRVYYYLGSTGKVEVNIFTSAGQAFDIRDMWFQLYLPRTDGIEFVTERFIINYTDTPLQLSETDNATVIMDFDIPARSDLITGIFRYNFYVNLRETGTTTYSEWPSGEQFAKWNDNDYCILISSETTPSPTPTNQPTPTPTPTSTPTTSPTPTPTATPTSTPTPTPPSTPVDLSLIAMLFGIGIVIIAVLLIIILYILKKGKK
jgi:hypothetical protein